MTLPTDHVTIVNVIRDKVPTFSLAMTAAAIVLVLHVWVFTLALGILDESRTGNLKTPRGFQLLRQLRNSLLALFLPSVFMHLLSNQFVLFLMNLASDQQAAGDSNQAWKAETLVHSFLSSSQHFFVWFDGFNAIVTGLLVGAVEYYLRESENLKTELDQVI